MAEQNDTADATAERSLDLNDMIDNPEKYGFSWDENNPLHKSGMKITDKAPYIKHNSIARMSEVFGETYFLDVANSANGARVRDQGALRDAIWADKKIGSDVRLMKLIVLEKALGRRTTRTRTTTVYEGLGGKTYATREEKNAGDLAFLVDRGMSVAEAKEALGLN